MRVIKPSTLLSYAARNTAALVPLSSWLAIAKRATWKSIVDVRKNYPNADGGVVVASGAKLTVFNIGGNKYRLVVAIHYNTQRIYIREVLTHAQYSKGTWKGRH